ncbi:DUF1800 family protein [Chitinimonas sp. BJYL2]|uniref:DUF1800 domain-containing protein n=1 Tax=Chitinimonas sp. BJYL2 TaxID=2976696 RepID=UPI0022B332B7|nr:DUF1800 domain-containing protein [Chitinimonas sp. BJYL2]
MDTQDVIAPSVDIADTPPVTSPAPGLASAALAASLLAACGGGGDGGSGSPPPAGGTPPTPTPTPAPSPPPAAITDPDAARFLMQAALAVTDADLAQVKAAGYSGWLDAQFALPRNQGHWDWMIARGYQNDPNNANGFQGTDNTLWRKLISAPDTLRQRMVLALSEIFVVSMTGLPVPWRGFCMAAYVDTLEEYAFGNYRGLLEAVTLSTGMGNYLNMRGNQKEDAKGRVPDENYAREVLQLFSLGLYQLNNDGTVKTGADGKPLDTYAQADISGLARVFTGWDYTAYDKTKPDFQRRPMSLVASRHSTLDKTFLGVTIPGSTPGVDALKIALDTIANHPNVGPFIGRQLIQRLVTSNPSAAYVGRVATAFNNTNGIRGDLKATLRAVLLDPEARSAPAAQPASWGKLREPVLRFVQWARTAAVKSPTDLWNIGDTSSASTRLGQSPLRSPSVFNFFRPGYVPPNTSLGTTGLVAPEFQITNESTVVAYLNYMQTVIQNGVGEVKPDYSGWLTLANDAAALVARCNLLLAAGQLSSSTQNTITNAVNAITASSDAARLNRIQAALLLTMASPEYLIAK